jgi:chromosome partitioning protein
VLRGEIHPREAMIKRNLRARLHVNGREFALAVTVIPSSLEFSEAEMILSSVPGRELLLRRAMAKIRGDFDYILLDCSPSLGLIAINALVAAQKVFIPVQTEHLALESLEKLLAKIEAVAAESNPELAIGGLIATRFDGRKVLNRMVVETLRERFGALLLDTMIRENIALAESPRYGMDIFSYRPRSFGSEDYLDLSLEIIGRIANADRLFSVERGVITSIAGSGLGL